MNNHEAGQENINEGGQENNVRIGPENRDEGNPENNHKERSERFDLTGTVTFEVTPALFLVIGILTYRESRQVLLNFL
ncbi:unnamed protein product [Penicillium glandicola]